MTQPKSGVVQQLRPELRCILAPNPSPMTYWGTNTYLLGHEEIVVIDPGPDDQQHMAAILAALTPTQRIEKIVVTHAHLDHAPLARALSQETGAAVYAYGDATAGRSALMQELAESGYLGGGEGVDVDFRPNVRVSHEEEIHFDGRLLRVLHTPGHFGNHIALALDDICFTGDLVMGWASSLVSPPDGDLTDFMASCEMLAQTQWQCLYPGHGAPIPEANARIKWLISHRRAREAQILQALESSPNTATALATQIYQDTAPELLPAAARNVFAHLLDLLGKEQASTMQGIGFKSVFKLNTKTDVKTKKM